MSADPAAVRLSRIWVYPVKSCAGIPVPEWDLDARGLRFDRSFMVVDAVSGEFLTQRELPELALITPRFAGDDLIVAAPGGTVPVPLRDDHAPTRRVRVWEHTGPAADCGDAPAQLLSDHLGYRVRLVAVPQRHLRTAEETFAGPDVPLGFSDGFPLLLIGAASLDALNARLAHPLPMNRFRPNLVVEGAAAFAEDSWSRIEIGGVPIDIVKPCARCTITTVDQATGRRDGAEPLRELGRFRRGERGVLFGQNAVHRATGTLRAGLPVAVR